jgi:hypothetical protein
MTEEKRRYWTILACLFAAQALLIWGLPVLPCQDLPQHLAYTRIFMDHGRPELRFGEFYTLPDHFEPYFTIYFVMAGLGKIFGVLGALRLVMTLYAGAIYVSMHLLLHAIRRTPTTTIQDPMWSTPLAVLLIWSPTAALGLLQFLICVPIFFVGCAGVVGWFGEHPRRIDRPLAIGACVALASLHLIALGCLVLFAGLYLVFQWRRELLGRGVAFFGAAAIPVGLWSTFGGLGVGDAKPVPFADANAESFGLDFLNLMYRTSWNDTIANASHVLWTVLGPYRMESQIFMGLVLIGATLYLRQEPRAVDAAAPVRKGDRRQSGKAGAPPAKLASLPIRKVAYSFAAVAWIVPWGFYVPSEVTFLNLRMMTLAFGLLLALVNPLRLTTRRAQRAVVAVAFIATCHFAYRAIAFNREEAAGALELIERVPPNKMLNSIVFHSRTDHFAKLFR